MPSGAKKRKAARRKKENVPGSPRPLSPTNPHPLPGDADSHHHRHEEEEDSASSGEEEALVIPMDQGTTKHKDVAEEEKAAAVPVSEEAQEVSVELIHVGAPDVGFVEDSSPAAMTLLPVVPANEEVEEVAEPAAETSKTSIEVTAYEEVVEVAEPAAETSTVVTANEEVVEVAEAVAETSTEVILPPVAPADGPPPANEEVVEVAEAAGETSKNDVEPLMRETEEKAVPVLNSLVSEAPRESSQQCCATGESEVSATLLEHRDTWWNCCGLFDVFTGSRGNTRT